MERRSFGEMIERFLIELRMDGMLPKGIEILDPYTNHEVARVVHEMVTKYYVDASLRIAIWGINPGRFGAGITGLSFTDPWAVSNLLGIETTLVGRRELSAEFISMVIEAYGGPKTFYLDVYMGALSPLGFVKNGNNINFYDDSELTNSIIPFVLSSLKQQQEAGLVADRCIVLGSGKLKQFMERTVRPSMKYKQVKYLDHPRYIMQYRRTKLTHYVEQYVATIQELVNPF